MRLSGQYKASLFFYEKILSVQKAQTIFNLLEEPFFVKRNKLALNCPDSLILLCY